MSDETQNATNAQFLRDVLVAALQSLPAWTEHFDGDQEQLRIYLKNFLWCQLHQADDPKLNVEEMRLMSTCCSVCRANYAIDHDYAKYLACINQPCNSGC